MSESTYRDIEASHLEKIAQEYRVKGYRVSVHPSSKLVPKRLQDFQPDLIARSSTDKVLVEVVAHSNRKRLKDLANVTNLAEGLRGWRVEVIILGANDIQASRELGENSLLERISESKQLLSEGRSAAALLLGWSCIEAIFRRVASSTDLISPGVRPTDLLSSLYSAGYLNKKQQERFLTLQKNRNEISHGFSSVSKFDRSLLLAFEDSVALLDELRVAQTAKAQTGCRVETSGIWLPSDGCKKVALSRGEIFPPCSGHRAAVAYMLAQKTR